MSKLLKRESGIGLTCTHFNPINTRCAASADADLRGSHDCFVSGSESTGDELHILGEVSYHLWIGKLEKP